MVSVGMVRAGIFKWFRRKRPAPNSPEVIQAELRACNNVERIMDGLLSWEELKRATLLEDELLERILNRLHIEGKIVRE